MYFAQGVSRALARFTGGLQGLKQGLKQSITDTITTTAEWGHRFYLRTDAMTRRNPRLLAEVNLAIDVARAELERLARQPTRPTTRPRPLGRYLTRDALNRALQANPQRLTSAIEREARARLEEIEYGALRRLDGPVLDLNPRTMGWGDLAVAWMFELGPQHFRFDEKAATTQQLFQEDGVKRARQEALNRLNVGNLTQVISFEPYDVAEYYESLRERNAATVFLGSYTTVVQVANNKNGTATLTFEIEQFSSWESATRLRKAASKDGPHQGIIPNRKRGASGIHLGGTMGQTWRWQETVRRSAVTGKW